MNLLDLIGIYELIMIPALGAIVIAILSKYKRISAKNIVLGGISALFALFTLYKAILVFREAYYYGFTLEYYITSSSNLSYLRADLLSALFLVLFSFIGFTVALYSIGYMEEKPALPFYYILLMLMVTSLNGIVLAGDFVTFFVFYEMLSVTAISLVSYFKNREAIEAAIKYILMDATGSALVLFGFAMLYGLTGTLDMGQIPIILNKATETYKYVTLAVLFSGFSFKTAIFPMHSWLIDAHPAAPSGISAMLSGLVIKTGFYAIVRSVLVGTIIFSVFNKYIILIAILTITVPNIIALAQSDIKRILAYSSIYNIGIIILGIGIGTQLSITAGIFHAVNHALLKALMFMAAGVLVHTTGKRSLEDLRGLGRKMPITGIYIGFGALALIGLPPLNAFYSKLLIAWSAVELGNTGILIAIIILVNSIISIGYYGKIIRYVIMKDPKENNVNHEESLSCTIAMTLLVAAVIIISINPNLVLVPIQEITKQLLQGL